MRLTAAADADLTKTRAGDYRNIVLDFDKAHVDQDAKVIRMGRA
jgi:hypothetical protein